MYREEENMRMISYTGTFPEAFKTCKYVPRIEAKKISSVFLTLMFGTTTVMSMLLKPNKVVACVPIYLICYFINIFSCIKNIHILSEALYWKKITSIEYLIFGILPTVLCVLHFFLFC